MNYDQEGSLLKTIKLDELGIGYVRDLRVKGNENGVVRGGARVPLDEFYYPIEHNAAVSPDGEVFALLPRPDSLDIVRLNFYQELERLIYGAAIPKITTSPGAP